MSPTRQAADAAGYASIMTHVHLGARAAGQIKLAASLAQTLSSRLIGIAAQDIELPSYVDGSAMVDQVLLDNARDAAVEDLAKAEGMFRSLTHASAAVEWRSAIDLPRAFALAQARAADLFVLSRQGPGDSSQGRMGIAPGDLVMDLGRPMLVVPPGVETLAAKRIVVAWKDTREARRAVRDALPLLSRAELVSVLAVGADAADQGAQDVCDYLSQHGIAARSVLRSDSKKYVVDAIVELAQEQGSDLIVAGAYGHSRLREWIFGGVTHDLLETAPVCCLMSH